MHQILNGESSCDSDLANAPCARSNKLKMADTSLSGENRKTILTLQMLQELLNLTTEGISVLRSRDERDKRSEKVTDT